MFRLQKKIKYRINNSHILNLTITSIFTLLIGTVFYHYVEGFDWIDAFYFSAITLTTVGYGDLAPETTIGKIFTIFYIIIGIGIIFGFINTLNERRIEMQQGNINKEKALEKSRHRESIRKPNS